MTAAGYWPAGLPRSLDYPTVTADRLIASAARLHGDRTAVVEGEVEWTFTELHAESCRFARALRRAGVEQRDVVMLHLSNSRWFLVSYFGALLAGAAVSPVNPLSPPSSLADQVADTEARVVVTQADSLAALTSARDASGDALRVVVVPGADAPTRSHDGLMTYADFVAGATSDPLPLDVGPDDVAHIVYTGGTTGVPKGVRVLHRNVVANVAQMVAWRACRALVAGDDRLLTPVRFPEDPQAPVVPGEGATVVVSPLFHSHALINTNFLLLCGVTAVLSERFSSDGLLALIERRQVSYLTGSPAMWHALINSPAVHQHDLRSLKVLSSGAAPIDVETLGRMLEAFPSAVVTEGYGLTEATCVATAGPAAASALRKPGSVGLPLFDTEVEIRPLDGSGGALPPGERGRLWLRGPQITDGYWGRPQETAAQYVDGWLDTGDIGYTDEDGFVYIADRAKDMLIYKGYNVYPRELEDVLSAHPDVHAVAVVGREEPAVGQIPVAFVVPRPGSQPDPDALMAYVAERVLPYKKVRVLRLVDSLPTSAAGKVVKTELRALVEGAS